MTDTPDIEAPPQGVTIQCEQGHEQRMELRGYTREMAIDFAQMLVRLAIGVLGPGPGRA